MQFLKLDLTAVFIEIARSTMDQPRRIRKCTFCCQELSHAAYYRHLQDTSGCVCPGKRDSISSTDSSDEEALSLPSKSDSSFDFGSDQEEEEEEEEDHIMQDEMEMDTTAYHSTNETNSSSESTSVNDDSDIDDVLDGEEIWAVSDAEDQLQDNQMSHMAQRVLHGLSLFLTKFQLVFKISERAMSALLLFLCSIFTYLSAIIKHPLLTELCQILPKTMWSVKKKIGVHSEGIIDYAVCPKCHSLLAVSDCNVTQNGKTVFLDKTCDHIEFPRHPHLSRRISVIHL